MPISEISAADLGKTTWQDAYLVEPHGGEELVTILPVARMTLYDCCIQISRRGCAKKMMKTSFESHVSKSFIGAGVKGKPDKTCNLVLCGKDDLLVLASREGYLWCLDVSQLPYTIEEVLKLSAIDYLATSFTIAAGADQKPDSKQSILILTNNGKAVHREANWLEKPATYKSRGQPVFSQSRREAGARVVSAFAVEENDWGAALSIDGAISVHKLSDLLSSGSLAADQPVEISEFAAFCAPGSKQ